ncbi:MAG: hypothetical protein F2903_07975 [Actinobacteria bacterium]|jgi:acyl dehydratase|uniref:Unannotated protein n=1 Tax=freshwater metagenome TaxID=449393 RepID=A0A6J7AN00_9ZZZZ|nr:hypothetical protein [Actinomycetota bacterium]MSX10625.1 hypothetical protein [Actinomycetota bacterium]MSX68913.1 hypothetical protein [Actinomycetota bacterium]
MADAAELEALVGTKTQSATVVIERAPLAFFAEAVFDDSQVYQDATVAEAEGFGAIPAPPTFPFVMDNWGRFPDIQGERVKKGPEGLSALGSVFSGGGLILHGEQSFSYERPVKVGDTLKGEGTVVEAYAKESKGKTMTFIVMETQWRDATTGDLVVTSRMNIINRV